MSVTKAVRRVEKHSTLQSKAFVAWLDEPLFELSEGNGKPFVSLTRRGASVLSESPCTRAVTQLMRTCLQFKIKSLDQLFDIGLHGLLRCEGVGERTAWIAALILEDTGYNVDRWIAFKPGRGVGRRGHIKLVHSKATKRKHG